MNKFKQIIDAFFDEYFKEEADDIYGIGEKPAEDAYKGNKLCMHDGGKLALTWSEFFHERESIIEVDYDKGTVVHSIIIEVEGKYYLIYHDRHSLCDDITYELIAEVEPVEVVTTVYRQKQRY